VRRYRADAAPDESQPRQAQQREAHRGHRLVEAFGEQTVFEAR